MLGEGVSGESLPKILHHVVALELTMDEHVDADFLLPAHGRLSLLTQEGGVIRITECPLGVGRTCFAHFIGLGE